MSNTAWKTTLPKWYVRCPNCLSIGAIDSTERPATWRSDYKRDEQGACVKRADGLGYVTEWQGGMLCSACGGHVEVMGQVTWTRKRLFENEQETPCDGRCTNAKGQNCDCSCGGHNHGTGATMTVARDKGAVPRVLVLDVETAKKRAAEWDAAWNLTDAAFEARFAPIRARKARREWLAGADYDEFNLSARCLDDMNDAAGMRTHKGRMDKLARVREACAK